LGVAEVGLLAAEALKVATSRSPSPSDKAVWGGLVKQVLQPWSVERLVPLGAANPVSRGLGSIQSKALWARERCGL